MRGPGDVLDIFQPAFDTRLFKLDAPGVYAIQLRYQYYSGSGVGVFTDSLDSNVLTFEIK